MKEIKVGVLSFDCEECGEHNELMIPIKKLKEKMDKENGVRCQHCGAENPITESIKQQLKEE